MELGADATPRAATITSSALAALVHGLATDVRLVDDVVAAARAQSPEAARLPREESRRHVAALIQAGCREFLGSGEPGDGDFSEAMRFGAEGAALGVPVAALLSGAHAGRSRILEIAISRGRTAGLPDDVMLHGLLRLDRYGNALERHVLDGYRAAERHLNTDRRAARIRLLRHLLLGEESSGEDFGQFGLSAEGRYHCAVSDAADPGRVRELEQAFARCGGVLAPVGGRLSGVTPRLPGFGGPAPALIVTTPVVPLHQAVEAHRLAQTALLAARERGATGLHSVIDLAGESALDGQPMLAGFLRDGLLAALDPGDEFHRDLVCTALSYLDRGQRLDRTAESLHLHPNTVRYRLRRLRELTGFGEDDAQLTVLETMRWWWALRTWARSAGLLKPER
ncbi:helix-turn-helix domain-containing protein [Actinoplanes sp. GCM10030250]|uniref:helix-turn-helix domain-containing protein n=1 Tax=Actinoplanes sp. GCM10030250 TaxID=3273376 RepID=UPI003616E985